MGAGSTLLVYGSVCGLVNLGPIKWDSDLPDPVPSSTETMDPCPFTLLPAQTKPGVSDRVWGGRDLGVWEWGGSRTSSVHTGRCLDPAYCLAEGLWGTGSGSFISVRSGFFRGSQRV